MNQREAFLRYIRKVKPVCETWTGWKKNLVLRLMQKQQNKLRSKGEKNR